MFRNRKCQQQTTQSIGEAVKRAVTHLLLPGTGVGK
jgi:hypothetical protein